MANDGIGAMIAETKTARIENFPDDTPDIDDDFDIAGRPAGNHQSGFDQSIHELKDGQPIKNKDGSFRKKRGRKTGVNYSAAGDDTGSDGFNYPESPQSNNLEMAAKTAAAIYIQTGVIVFGPEWLPDPKAMEQEQLEYAFKMYFEAKGITDIPPGVALAITCAAYAAKRLYQPVTQSRVAYMIGWIRGKFSRRKADATRNDTRANGLRENDPGKANGSRSKTTWRQRFSARS